MVMENRPVDPGSIQGSHRRTSFIRPLFMGAESCEKSESFVATFGRKLWSITLFLHARLWGDESFVHGSGGIRRRVG